MIKLNNPDLLRDRAFMHGEWCSAGSGNTLNVEDPATGEVIGSVPDCDSTDTGLAIDSAAAAFDDWRSRTAAERSAVLERWHTLVLENQVDLGRILTAEQGKPLAEAEGEIRYAASFIKWFAEEGKRVYGHSVPAPERDRCIWTIQEPVGVSVAITPWNFPAAMITRKCAPALAAGCPILVKPSELTPLTALALARLAELSGVPAGVFSVITGKAKDIGGEMTSNPLVRKLSFTGSTKIGSLLIRQCAETVKRMSMELGGNGPLLVFDDADIELAVASTVASKFRNAGQTCVSVNRIIVHNKVYDQFAECTLDKDRYVAPVVLTEASPDMLLSNEETFGPVAPLFRFDDEDEAITLANATPYGLASYFYTESLHRAFRVAKKLEAGMVALNTGSIAMEMAAFGGIKQSGFGREGGKEGIEEYLEKKAFHIGNLKE